MTISEGTLAIPAQAGQLSTARRDPREDWPTEAHRLRDDLVAEWGEADPLPDVAGGWIAHYRTTNTRRTYTRHFRVWSRYCRERGHHPLAAAFPLADAFARHLETAPTMVRVKGGVYGEMAPTSQPYAGGRV